MVVVAIILAASVVQRVTTIRYGPPPFFYIPLPTPEFMNERPFRSHTSANGLPFSCGGPPMYFCRCDIILAVHSVADRLLPSRLIAPFVQLTIGGGNGATRSQGILSIVRATDVELSESANWRSNVCRYKNIWRRSL